MLERKKSYSISCHKIQMLVLQYVYNYDIGFKLPLENYRVGRFGAGSGSIHLGSVTCQGTESFLANCSLDVILRGCSHSQDAGVHCFCEFLIINIMDYGSKQNMEVLVQ